MNAMIERAAMAAFWHWRNIPLLPEPEMRAAWDAMADAMKEPWRRTARMVIQSLRNPTEEVAGVDTRWNGSETYPEENTFVWQKMVDAILDPTT